MINRKVAWAIGAAGCGALLLAVIPELRSAADPALPAVAPSADIRIDNFNFTPPTLVVAPGTRVTWTNADDEAHTVVEKERKFKSAALDTDDTYSQTFTAPGEYEYICSIHPYMTGKIVVKPGA
jgi:plastocyanin